MSRTPQFGGDAWTASPTHATVRYWVGMRRSAMEMFSWVDSNKTIAVDREGDVMSAEMTNEVFEFARSMVGAERKDTGHIRD